MCKNIFTHKNIVVHRNILRVEVFVKNNNAQFAHKHIYAYSVRTSYAQIITHFTLP